MWYFIIIAIAIFTVKWTERNVFRWETLIKYLWKLVYIKSNEMALHMQQFNITEYDKLSLDGFKYQIDLRGNFINSVLDYINNLKREEGEDVVSETEEETFGYGRYNFETILMLAKSNPDSFKKFK